MTDTKSTPLVEKEPDIKPPSTPVYVGDTILGVVTAGLWTLGGLYVVNPRETRLLLHFGQLTHIESTPGIHWAPNFGRDDRLISTGASPAHSHTILMLTAASPRLRC